MEAYEGRPLQKNVMLEAVRLAHYRKGMENDAEHLKCNKIEPRGRRTCKKSSLFDKNKCARGQKKKWYENQGHDCNCFKTNQHSAC